MLPFGWYSMQGFHKSWQSYTPVNMGTICVKVHPFRLLPNKGNTCNCSLIPYHLWFIFVFCDDPLNIKRVFRRTKQRTTAEGEGKNGSVKHVYGPRPITQ